MENFVPQSHTTPTPWYKQIGKTLLFIIIGFLGIGILFFIVFFGYYLWIGKYGDVATQTQLTKQFQENFTISPELRSLESNQTINTPTQSIIHEHNPRFGNPDAAVTIVAFVDFECPFCGQAYPSFKLMMEKYAPAVQVVFKHFPIDSIHPNAKKASLAAQCAHKQDTFWEYHNILFTKKQFDDSSLFSYALQLRLNATQFQTCLNSDTNVKQIEQDFQDGLALGVRGTPTYIINQKKIEGNVPAQAWDTIIVQSLQR
jgi:protein-disulfide isomerase